MPTFKTTFELQTTSNTSLKIVSEIRTNGDKAGIPYFITSVCAVGQSAMPNFHFSTDFTDIIFHLVWENAFYDQGFSDFDKFSRLLKKAVNPSSMGLNDEEFRDVAGLAFKAIDGLKLDSPDKELFESLSPTEQNAVSAAAMSFYYLSLNKVIECTLDDGKSAVNSVSVFDVINPKKSRSLMAYTAMLDLMMQFDSEE